MKHVAGLRCVACGREYAPDPALYVCQACKGNLEVLPDYRLIAKRLSRRQLEADPERGIWRYLDLLPLNGREFACPLQIGWTPLYPSRKLGADLGLANLYIKDDGRNPSASFKDRAGAVALAHAMERGERLITGASTGNAASSLACLSSVMGMKTVIFLPETAPLAKIAQLLVYGAQVIAVKGTYDQAFDLCLQASAEYGWYNRNTGYNPYTREGKKTCSYELVEQLGWEVPDKVFVSVGDGNIISGIWKGFRDFYELGWIDRLPQLVAVQAQGSDAVHRALLAGPGAPIPEVDGTTLADSISVSIPRDGLAAVRAVRESGGFSIWVKDEEVLDAMKVLARSEGVFAEPAGATAVAGLRRAVAEGKVGSGERVVTLITGNGLKDVASAMKAAGEPYRIAPEMAELKKLLARLGGRL